MTPKVQGFVKIVWEKRIMQYANDIRTVISSRYEEWEAMELTILTEAQQRKPLTRYVMLQSEERIWYPLTLGYDDAYVAFE